MPARGALITFEGVEGSGKSTQARRLAGVLAGRGPGVCATSEPDGTPLGRAVRSTLEVEGSRPTPLAEALLFLAARQQHVAEVIRPALERGDIVISDRYLDATVAYQGHGRGLDIQTIAELNLIATGGILPDLTIVLDLPVERGLGRIAGRAHDSFERLGLDFHARVRRGYLDIAAADKARVVLIAADRPEDEVARDVWRAAGERLGDLLGGG